MTATEQYVSVLTLLKPGELGLLRTHAGQGLDESVDAFDLFTGLWWPLRQRNERAPKRDIAWLIAKLYAFCPISHSRGDTLAGQLRLCQPQENPARERFQKKLDQMLMLPVAKIEPALRWALGRIASKEEKVDWVMLTDDLWRWERESTRLKWAQQFLGYSERGKSC